MKIFVIAIFCMLVSNVFSTGNHLRIRDEQLIAIPTVNRESSTNLRGKLTVPPTTTIIRRDLLDLNNTTPSGMPTGMPTTPTQNTDTPITTPPLTIFTVNVNNTTTMPPTYIKSSGSDSAVFIGVFLSGLFVCMICLITGCFR